MMQFGEDERILFPKRKTESTKWCRIRTLQRESAREFKRSKPRLECLPGRPVRLRVLCQTPEEQEACTICFVLVWFVFAFLAEMYMVGEVF